MCLVDSDNHDTDVSGETPTDNIDPQNVLDIGFVILMRSLTSDRIPPGTTRTCFLCEEDDTITDPFIAPSTSRLQRHIDSIAHTGKERWRRKYKHLEKHFRETGEKFLCPYKCGNRYATYTPLNVPAESIVYGDCSNM